MDNDRGKAQIAVASTGPAVPAGGVLATARFQVQEGVLAQEVLVRLSFRASDEKFEDVPMTAGHSGTVKIR